MAKVRPTESVLANFRRVVPRLVSRYFARGRLLVEDKAGYAALHRFRIRTKRLRYTLELYAGLFPDVLDTSLQTLQKLQRALGNLQDANMVHAWLSDKRPGPSSAGGYDALVAAAACRRKLLRKQFYKEWRELEESGAEKELLHRIKRRCHVPGVSKSNAVRPST